MSLGAFHLHTNHSFDSLTRPKDIVLRAINKQIKILAITDHDTWAGSQEALAFATKSNLTNQLQVILGAEYATDCGDIIGLFLKEEVRSKNAIEVINHIHHQGGIVILPHPFYHHKQIEMLGKAADLIEVFNARCTDDENNKASDLARKLNKPMIAGSDAHFLHEMDHVTLSFDAESFLTPSQLCSITRTWHAQNSSLNMKILSQVIKGVKKKNLKIIAYSCYSLLLSLASIAKKRGAKA